MIPEQNLIPTLIEFSEEYGALLRKIEGAARGHGIGSAEARVLRLLLHRPLSAADVSQELQMDSGQLSRLVSSLLEKDLVARKGATSKRSYLLLTEDGRDRAAKLVRRQFSAAQALWSQMDATSKERFLATVGQLGDHVFQLEEVVPRIRDADAGETGILIREGVRTFTQKVYGYHRKLEIEYLRIFSRVLTVENIILVVERQRAIVGGLAMTVDRPTLTGTIEYLAMFDWEQGHGWGTQLLEAATSRAQSSGLRRLLIEFPISRFGDSYFAGLRIWTRQSVRRRVWCGCSRNWETWTRRL